MNFRFIPSPRLLCGGVLFVVLLCGGGCSSWNKLRGDPARDDLAKWGETQRPTLPVRKPAPLSDIWSFNEQARQVERNLGVR